MESTAKHFICLLGGLISLPGMGWAEQDFFALSLEQLTQVDVSGATFSSETLESAPASVSVFTQ